VQTASAFPGSIASPGIGNGDYRLLEFIADRCGCRILRGEEAVVAELGALAMQEKQLKNDSRKSTVTLAMPLKIISRSIKTTGAKMNNIDLT
jgi:hypothetical protein